MDDEQAIVDEAHVVEILHRPDAGRRPFGIPRPDVLHQRFPRSPAGREQLDFFDVLRGMHAAWHERHLVDGLLDRAKKERRHRVRRVRGQRRANLLGGRQVAEIAERLGHHRVEVAVHVEADQLPEDHAGQRALRQLVERHEQRVRNLADERGAAPEQLLDRRVHTGGDRRIREEMRLPPLRDDLTRPRGERRGRRDLIAQVRELEVGVRVDEARHDGDVAELDARRRIVGRTTPEGDDAPAIDGDPAVLDRFAFDGNDPRGVVADQLGMIRSCLPARLRAG